MATLIQQRDELIKSARSIAENAQTTGRDLNPSELEKITTITTQVKSLNEKIQSHKKSQDLLDSLGGPRSSKAGHLTYRKSDAAAFRTAAAKIGQNITGRKDASLGLTTGPGGFSVGPELLTDQPVMLDGQSTPFLSQIIGRKQLDSNAYEYIRQTVRDNKAAIVKPGDLKPTSTYGFEEVKGELYILAHVSQPMHKYWAEDYPEIVTSVAGEMLLGLVNAEENLMLHGDGTNGAPTGIFNTSGIQTIAASGDLLTTTRKAITALETLQFQPFVYAMNPLDWERIELSRDAAGRLEFEDGPVDRSQKKLWSTNVAVSTHIPQGTALLLGQDSLFILDRGKIDFETSTTSGEDFERNQMKMRCEERIGLEIARPSSIVKISLDPAKTTA